MNLAFRSCHRLNWARDNKLTVSCGRVWDLLSQEIFQQCWFLCSFPLAEQISSLGGCHFPAWEMLWQGVPRQWDKGAKESPATASPVPPHWILTAASWEMWMKRESRRMRMLCPEIWGKKHWFGRAKGAQSGREGRKRRKKAGFWSLLHNERYLVTSGPPSWVSDTREWLCDTPGLVEAGTGVSVKEGFIKNQSSEGAQRGWGAAETGGTRRSEVVAAPSLSAPRLMGACSPSSVWIPARRNESGSQIEFLGCKTQHEVRGEQQLSAGHLEKPVLFLVRWVTSFRARSGKNPRISPFPSPQHLQVVRKSYRETLENSPSWRSLRRFSENKKTTSS